MLVLGLRRSGHIAVVEMEGTIGPRIKAPEFVRLFRSLEENRRVGAVVLDIDSPGGSVTASEYIYLAIQSLAKKKPVIAFIRGLGASGGYLLSCAASKIVAIPTAIVGSIGVIAIHPLVYDTMGRLGLKVEVTKSDQFKDMGSMFREPTAAEREKEQALIDELYEHFMEAVAQGRNMTADAVKQIATGEIFTARKGKELGLVDELGDIERAIDIAAELGKTARRPVFVRPRRGLREVVGSLVTGPLVEQIAGQVESRLMRGLFYQHLG